MPEPRRIEGHPDFGALERRLEVLIRETKEGAPFAPVAVIAPTRRLLAHLQVRLAGRFPSLLGVRFLTHESLAREAAAAAQAPLPRALADGVREQILRTTIEGEGGALAPYVRARPGSVAALLSTLDDLREAGVEPSRALALKSLGGEGREIVRLHASYGSRLDSLAVAGLADRAGLLRAALPHLRAFAAGFRLIVHYGAYDLIGANLDLIKALESSATRVVHLVPFHATGPAYEYARGFWEKTLGRIPDLLAGEGAGDRLFGGRLRDLYDEEARPAPFDDEADSVSLFHAQGTEAELREVALRILALHAAEKIPLNRIGVVARSLEPYAALLARVFAAHRLPFTTTGTLGAPREARVQAALDLMRATLGDFERQPFLDLCRSGLLRLEGLDTWIDAHDWDRLGRDFRVARGAATWRSLPDWVERWNPEMPAEAGPEAAERLRSWKAARLAQARGLAAAVEALQQASRPLRSAKGWSEWADAFGTLRDRLFHPPDPDRPAEGEEAGMEALRQIDGALRDLGAAGVPFSTSAAQSFVEGALARSSVRIPSGRDDRGVQVLDAMQARGLSFEALFLIGLNADLIPRRPREDPFLSDADRSTLRSGLKRPLPIKGAAREEEHLLLALLLGAAERRLTLSWQRADDDGRARVPSLALREVARILTGTADFQGLVRRAHRVPADPREAVMAAVEERRLLPPAQAGLHTALDLASPALLLEAAPDLPAPAGPLDREVLAAGLSMLKVIEDAEATDLRFDASVRDAVPPPPLWSPSRLEVIGACPQHYFFRHTLRVDELEEPVDGYDLDAREIGAIVHEVLRDVYGRIFGIARRDGEPAGEVARGTPAREIPARDLADEAWRRFAAGLAGRMRPRYPLLWESISSLLIESLRRFLEEDLSGLAAAGDRVIATEEEAPAALDLGGGRRLAVRGRFDRIVRRRDGGLVVSDYKSSGDLDRQVSITEALKGIRLQIPLYVLMAETLRSRWTEASAPIGAEVLGVGPGFDNAERRATLDAEKFGRHRDAFLESISVLLGLAESGHYPLNRDSRFCRTCPYLRACRRNHPPTLDRLAAAPAGRDYALLRRKSTHVPTLAAARAATAPEEP